MVNADEIANVKRLLTPQKQDRNFKINNSKTDFHIDLNAISKTPISP